MTDAAKTDDLIEHLDTLHQTAVQVLTTVIRLDQATFTAPPSVTRLQAELHAQLCLLAYTIDALPADYVQARPKLRLAELARLPGLLERPDIEPSVRVLRRTLEPAMRDIVRLIPRRARVAPADWQPG